VGLGWGGSMGADARGGRRRRHSRGGHVAPPGGSKRPRHLTATAVKEEEKKGKGAARCQLSDQSDEGRLDRPPKRRKPTRKDHLGGKTGTDIRKASRHWKTEPINANS